jgi:outer membrane protein OmpA-like peptidoglycan-associated protein
MRLRTVVSLLVPALAIMGCASQKTMDSQAQSANQQIDDLRKSHAALSAAQQKLEARLSRLEADSTIHASRLDQMGPTSEELKRELEALRTQSASTQSGLSALSGKVDSQGTALAEVRETAEDAVKIARDSRMVSGKVVDSLTLTQDMVLYSYEQPELTAKGRVAMDNLIASVKPLMPHAFIEIIGFSDDFSLNSQNRQIALERAESVRRYLHEIGGIPLHRMSTISYGDLKPVASNATMESRSLNRRVVIQVLK